MRTCDIPGVGERGELQRYPARHQSAKDLGTESFLAVVPIAEALLAGVESDGFWV
ncbi:MAG: hypothetical protein LBM17_03530 [Candidatus Accumulibacter sp.]|nr:hypothetical protein [Accumulibacter sp.]